MGRERNVGVPGRMCTGAPARRLSAPRAGHRGQPRAAAGRHCGAAASHSCHSVQPAGGFEGGQAAGIGRLMGSRLSATAAPDTGSGRRAAPQARSRTHPSPPRSTPAGAPAAAPSPRAMQAASASDLPLSSTPCPCSAKGLAVLRLEQAGLQHCWGGGAGVAGQAGRRQGSGEPAPARGGGQPGRLGIGRGCGGKARWRRLGQPRRRSGHGGGVAPQARYAPGRSARCSTRWIRCTAAARYTLLHSRVCRQPDSCLSCCRGQVSSAPSSSTSTTRSPLVLRQACACACCHGPPLIIVLAELAGRSYAASCAATVLRPAADSLPGRQRRRPPTPAGLLHADRAAAAGPGHQLAGAAGQLHLRRLPAAVGRRGARSINGACMAHGTGAPARCRAAWRCGGR
jgi:hypothetical protein